LRRSAWAGNGKEGNGWRDGALEAYHIGRFADWRYGETQIEEMRMRLMICCFTALVAGPALAQPAVTIAKPWMRYLLPNVPAAGYMVVQNNRGSDITITGAASPDCGMLMLHESTDSSGMAMMMDVPTITVPAHGSVTFAPGGYHLMCMQPAMKVGGQVPVTLTLGDGTKLAATLPVYGAQGSP